MFSRALLALLLVVACAARSIAQTTISGTLTVDDVFTAYISTSNTVAGTSVAVGTYWGNPVTFTANLTPGVTNYLHIVATDNAPPNGFLGSFTLSDAGFRFADGSQSLVTSPGTFLVSSTGFGVNEVTPTSAGLNGVSPWGFFSGISSSAQWLNFAANGTVYFSAAIMPVPEPLTSVLLALGGVALLLRPRKRR